MSVLVAMALRQQRAHRIGNRAPIAPPHFAKVSNDSEKRRVIQHLEIGDPEIAQFPCARSGSEPRASAMNAQCWFVEMRRDPARNFGCANEARVNDRAVPKVNRNGLVLAADSDQLPVD